MQFFSVIQVFGNNEVLISKPKFLTEKPKKKKAFRVSYSIISAVLISGQSVLVHTLPQIPMKEVF